MAKHQRNASIDPKLLDLLACPLTKGALEYDPESGELFSKSAGLAYPIRDGIAVMLPSEARSIDGDGQDDLPEKT